MHTRTRKYVRARRKASLSRLIPRRTISKKICLCIIIILLLYVYALSTHTNTHARTCTQNVVLRLRDRTALFPWNNNAYLRPQIDETQNPRVCMLGVFPIVFLFLSRIFSFSSCVRPVFAVPTGSRALNSI